MLGFIEWANHKVTGYLQGLQGQWNTHLLNKWVIWWLYMRRLRKRERLWVDLYWTIKCTGPYCGLRRWMNYVSKWTNQAEVWTSNRWGVIGLVLTWTVWNASKISSRHSEINLAFHRTLGEKNSSQNRMYFPSLKKPMHTHRSGRKHTNMLSASWWVIGL